MEHHIGTRIIERLDADNMEILTAVLGAVSSNAGNFRLRVGNIVGRQQIGIGAHLQLAFLFQLMVRFGTILEKNLPTGARFACPIKRLPAKRPWQWDSRKPG